MSKERWVGTAQPVKPISRTFGLVAHPLELATCPPDDIGIDPLQGRTQLRLVEVAVVGDPAPNARVVHLGQFSQGLVAAVMQRPAVLCVPTNVCSWWKSGHAADITAMTDFDPIGDVMAASTDSYFLFASDLAISRAQSINPWARGLSVRFLRVRT